MKVEWSDYAESDRHRIYDYIDADSPRNAILVDERIWNSIAVLAKFPEIGRLGRMEGTRELVIQRTPCIAAYLIEGNIIFILRVLHGAQRWAATTPTR